MAGRERPKRKALHRGLDDIINRDASLTSRLLGRVKQPSREPLETSAPDEGRKAEPEDNDTSAPGSGEPGSPPASARPAAVSATQGTTGSSTTVEISESRRTSTTKKRGAGGALRAIEQSKTTLPRGKRHPRRNKAPISGPGIVPVSAPVSSFEGFVERWGFILRSGARAGKLRLCEVLYNNTHAIGRATFFTSYEKLAKLANLEKKQCAINIRQLESLGFIERPSIFNTATKQGTEFKLHLDQLPPGERQAPRYHRSDKEPG